MFLETSSWFLNLWILFFIIISTYYLYYKLYISKYWAKRNAPHEDPVFIIGNIGTSGITESFSSKINSFYRKWKDDRLVGIWAFSKPALVITDLELIKRVLVKDFNNFRDHRFPMDFDQEPLLGHLFNLSGAKWRNLRVKLAPTFTSGKMKMMFPTIVECGELLREQLSETVENQEAVDVKDLLARYTTDVISNCAFGIETNSLKNPNSEFRMYGKKFFQPSLKRGLSNFLFNFNPKLTQFLRLPLIPEDVSSFFKNVVRDVMEHREKNKIERRDFMQLLIQLKSKGKLDHVDEVITNGTHDNEYSVTQETKFTLNEAAAQAFVFFVAGFETSSSAFTLALYELALNESVQTTLQKEIDKVLEKYNNKLSYEALMEMEYLDWVIQETLRKYPPIPVLFRKCNEDYQFPRTNVKMEKGGQIFIPIWGLQKDPEIFPNPENFDPTRFCPEERQKRDSFTSLPFGEGPRICIGNRFAMLQIKVGLVFFLSKFNVKISKQTPIPIKFDVGSAILTPVGGLYLKIENRKY